MANEERQLIRPIFQRLFAYTYPHQQKQPLLNAHPEDDDHRAKQYSRAIRNSMPLLSHARPATLPHFILDICCLPTSLAKSSRFQPVPITCLCMQASNSFCSDCTQRPSYSGLGCVSCSISQHSCLAPCILPKHLAFWLIP